MGSLFQGKQYVIQAFSPITDDKEIDLNLNASGNYTYSIKAVELSNINETQEVYLRDNLNGTYFDLRSTDAYEFSSDAGAFPDRFDIVFRIPQSLSNNTLSISLTNILGQNVKSINNVSNSSMENGISIKNLSSGMYIVNIVTKDNSQLSKKIMLE